MKLMNIGLICPPIFISSAILFIVLVFKKLWQFPPVNPSFTVNSIVKTGLNWVNKPQSLISYNNKQHLTQLPQVNPSSTVNNTVRTGLNCVNKPQNLIYYNNKQHLTQQNMGVCVIFRRKDIYSWKFQPVFVINIALKEQLLLRYSDHPFLSIPLYLQLIYWILLKMLVWYSIQ